MASCLRSRSQRLAVPSLLRTGRALWTPAPGALACVIVAPVAGMLAYSAYLAWLTGNPFQWSAQHAAWGRTFTGLAPFVDVAGMIAYEGVGRYVSMAPYDAFNVAAVAVALALVIPIWRAFGVPYALFVCVNVIPPLVKGGSMSMGRLSSTLFPLFLYLASQVQPPERPLAHVRLRGVPGVSGRAVLHVATDVLSSRGGKVSGRQMKRPRAQTRSRPFP